MVRWWQPEYRSRVSEWFRTPLGRRLGFGVGAVSTASAAGVPWPVRLLLAFVAAVLGEGAGRAFAHEDARKDWQIDLRNYLQAAVTTLEQYHEDDSSEFRGNVMLPEGDRLRIAYQYGRYSKEELELTVADFFPGRTGGSVYAKARKVCSACPVTEQCLEDALTHAVGLSATNGFRFGRQPIP